MSNSTISWKSDPDFRGTFNILSTCFSTLLICVWSAVHDDIAKGKQGYRAIFRKIGWLIIGLLAPELLLYVSFSQYITAGRILREADRAFGTSSPPSSRRSWWSIGRRKRTRSQVPPDDQLDAPSELPLISSGAVSPDKSPDISVLKDVCERKHRWTLTHAFFATMGGFQLNKYDDEGQSYLPAWQGEAMITPEGVRFLLKYAPHLIPDIPVEEIRDRSKADGLAKALLVWQVLWFCVNSGIRLAQKLPLSLLEVATIAHGLSTLITYGFWWEKPLNVKGTMLIGGQTKEAAALGSWMSLTSDAERDVLGGITFFGNLGEYCRLTFVSARSLLEAARNVDHTNESPTFTLDIREYGTLTEPNGPRIELDEMIPYCFSVSDNLVVTASPQWPDADPSMNSPRARSGESYTFDLSESANSSKDDTAVILPLHYPWDEALSPFDWNEPWDSLECARRVFKANFVFRGQPPWNSLVSYDRPLMEVDPTSLRRWRHAGTLPRYTRRPLGRIAVTDRPLIAPIATLQSSLNDSGGDIALGFLSTMLPAAYGLPHLLGWNATFPTHVEQLLWRVAALTVTASGLVVLSFTVLLFIIGNVAAKPIIHNLLIPVALTIYVSASGYLLVESFRQLFALPPEAFQLPSWANSIPHFT